MYTATPSVTLACALRRMACPSRLRLHPSPMRFFMPASSPRFPDAARGAHILWRPSAPDLPAAAPGGGAGRLRQGRCTARRWRRTGWGHARAGSGRGDRSAGRCRSADRTAGPAGGLSRGTGAGPRGRHPAAAPVQGRQRCKGRSGAVPHRRRALPGHVAECPGQPGPCPGEPGQHHRGGRALQAAGGRERDQPAGVHQRGGGPEGRRGGCGRRQGRSANRGHQSQLCQRDRTHLGPHRPGAGDRGRAGRAGRGDRAGRDPAGRPAVCQLHPVGHRGHAPEARDGGRPAQGRR